MNAFLEMQHAAELAGASVYLKSLFNREQLANPDFVEMRVRIWTDDDGEVVIETESLGKSGFPIGGFSI
jgi:predicted SpoU family rRNA methylase